jgi:hypothetical protein
MLKKPMLAAALCLVLIVPAALFMAALVIRNLPLSGVANAAQRVVMWYAGKVWTLWVLLLALPFVVMVTGWVVVFRDRIAAPNGGRQAFALIRAQPMGSFFAALILSAGGIIAIVVLHMLAN